MKVVFMLVLSVLVTFGESGELMERLNKAKNDVIPESEKEEFIAEENLGRKNTLEGDIMLDKTTAEEIAELMNPLSKRDAMKDPVRHWPNGRVPYVFGDVSDLVKRKFQEAINDYNKFTCIKIVPKQATDIDYIQIVNEGGCWSSLGRSGGRQKLSLAPGCEYKGTAIHELMHAIGFFHEQSRSDRDKYIKIHWENINKDMSYNFEKYRHGEADTLGEPYDYNSVMHYPVWAFTSNGKDTIEPNNHNAHLGQRNGFSDIDVDQINKLYRCQNGVSQPRPSSFCDDYRDACLRWKNNGFCKKGSYVTFMRKNCSKTCGFC